MQKRSEVELFTKQLYLSRVFSLGKSMRRNIWIISILIILFLGKGTGAYAMVHCQPTFQNTETSMVEHQQPNDSIHAQHNHSDSGTLATIPYDMNSQTNFEDTCQACDDCCSIHCIALPSTVVMSAIETHDKVLQHSYFHSSAVVPTKERPPKSV